jgi:hypothetical protein
MLPEGMVGELRAQLRARPYLTLAGVFGVGWVLGRSVPFRALVALAGVGARAVVASALEGAVRDGVRPSRARGRGAA